MFYYVTVLSNWLQGYDKYSQEYSKKLLDKSTYPDKFFLLTSGSLSIGKDKAAKLLDKLNIANNKAIMIASDIPESDVSKNPTGRGWILQKNSIPITKLYIKEADKWNEISIEDVTAQAFALKQDELKEWSELVPRTLSILPVGIACQASCWFCFSESSISTTKESFIQDLSILNEACIKAKQAGAERFVITGGGEPGLLKFDNLIEVIRIAKQHFDKIILITNGIFLSSKSETEREFRLKEMVKAGLSVLAISRHSHDSEINNSIMGIDIQSEKVFESINKLQLPIRTRLICVLQKQGVHNSETIEKYLDYAAANSVGEVCFKELYVAATSESLYSISKENKYCQEAQIPLKVVVDYCNPYEKIAELPWGSPVYGVTHNQQYIKIAAYTEPSVGWERKNGIARSWNLMSDGKCYASLEDLKSEV